MSVRKSKQDRDDLIFEYEKLVEQTAKTLMTRFRLAGSLFDELISTGYMALVEAAENSRADGNDTFQAYASIRIRGAMIDMLRSTTVLSRKSHRFIKAMHAVQHLREEDVLQSEVLKDHNATPKEKLARVLDLAGKGALAFQLSSSEVQEEIEAVPDTEELADEKIDRQKTINHLRELIQRLPEKERSILEQYYFKDKSFVAIANDDFKSNKSWVSRLHSRALEKLRSELDANPI